MSHGTHMKESWHICEWVMAHIWMSLRWIYHTDEVHVWMSHGTHMNELCHTYKSVVSHIWMSHVTHESCCTYEWVMQPIWMSCVTRVNKSCPIKTLLELWSSAMYIYVYICLYIHIYTFICKHIHIYSELCIKMSHVTRMSNESCHTYNWVMSLKHTARIENG